MKFIPTVSTVVPPVAADQLTRFVPESEKDKENPKAFLIRPDTYRIKTVVNEFVTPLLMKMPMEQDLNDAAVNAATALLEGDVKAQALEILGAYAAHLSDPSRLKDDKKAADGLADAAREIWRDLMPYSDALAVLSARRVAVVANMRFQSVRVYLHGWENTGVDFVTGKDGLVTEDCLVKIDTDVGVIADFLQKRAAPAEDVAKN
jgi:hypothetical protein